MRVLLADPEERRAKRLDEAMAGRGCSVSRASHGAEALQVALAAVPDVLVCALELPIIEGGRLAEILRANPHMGDLAVIFLAEDELDAPVSIDLRDRIVVAPWDTDAVLAHLHAPHLSADGERVLPEGAPAVGGGESALDPRRDPGASAPRAELAPVSAQVAELPLSDLLQVLQQNRRSGSVRFSPPGGETTGVVRLVDGRVIEAAVEIGDGGRVRGEKALFRLLDATEGRFDFAPEELDDPDDTEPHIQRPLNTLLVEAARQRDEWARHRALLPQPHAFLRLQVGRKEIATASHPLTAAVLDALETHARVGEIVDRCSFPDYQVLRVLHELMRSGAARVELGTDPAVAADRNACEWLDADAVRRVREWMASRRAGLGAGAKLLVVPGSPEAFDALDRALRTTQGYTPGSDAKTGLTPLGPLGRLTLGQGIGLWLVAAPPDPAFAPIWRVAADGALGTLIVVRPPVSDAFQVCAELLHEVDAQVPDRPRALLVAGAADVALESPEPGLDVFALEHPQVTASSADGAEEPSETTATTDTTDGPAGLREAIKRLLP